MDIRDYLNKKATFIHQKSGKWISGPKSGGKLQIKSTVDSNLIINIKFLASSITIYKLGDKLKLKVIGTFSLPLHLRHDEQFNPCHLLTLTEAKK